MQYTSTTCVLNFSLSPLLIFFMFNSQGSIPSNATYHCRYELTTISVLQLTLRLTCVNSCCMWPPLLKTPILCVLYSEPCVCNLTPFCTERGLTVEQYLWGVKWLHKRQYLFEILLQSLFLRKPKFILITATYVHPTYVYVCLLF